MDLLVVHSDLGVLCMLNSLHALNVLNSPNVVNFLSVLNALGILSPLIITVTHPTFQYRTHRCHSHGSNQSVPSLYPV